MSDTCGCSCEHDHIHIIVPVKGMHCEQCEAQLETALNALPGIHATANYELGCVTLLLHDQDDLNKAKEIILEQGYEL